MYTYVHTKDTNMLLYAYARTQVEADIVPFRGLLLGLFFITVGFSIDIGLVFTQFPKVAHMHSHMITFVCAYE